MKIKILLAWIPGLIAIWFTVVQPLVSLGFYFDWPESWPTVKGEITEIDHNHHKIFSRILSCKAEVKIDEGTTVLTIPSYPYLGCLKKGGDLLTLYTKEGQYKPFFQYLQDVWGYWIHLGSRLLALPLIYIGVIRQIRKKKAVRTRMKTEIIDYKKEI